ncbi:hypothetical protein TNCV_202731 [Trichonephila clavipes]|nr:hypothetical protein TNCV_202731 [Trichonephila clavipes]
MVEFRPRTPPPLLKNSCVCYWPGGSSSLIRTMSSSFKFKKKPLPFPMHCVILPCGRGSLVVKVSDRGWLVTSSSPVPLKTHRVERGAKHVKSLESSNVLPLV